MAYHYAFGSEVSRRMAQHKQRVEIGRRQINGIPLNLYLFHILLHKSLQARLNHTI